MLSECVALLLAGGKGTRLCELTNDKAKPFVSFGSKYKLIDFPLSNLSNSGIKKIGIITQYCPYELCEYISDGRTWNFCKENGGVSILSPFENKTGKYFFNGTADAVYRNINFIKKKYKYVMILSADHIYNTDYNSMIKEHIEKKADMTVFCIDVPEKETHRFGIMTVDECGYVNSFEEKPQNSKSSLASMGIYIFNTEILINYLLLDSKKAASSHDFGKDIIPAMIKDKRKIYAYKYYGYWRDVGSIEALWAANRDLLKSEIRYELFSRNNKVMGNSTPLSCVYVGENGIMADCISSGKAKVMGNVQNSIIFDGAIIEAGAEVFDSIVFENAIVHSGAKVNYSIINEGCEVDYNEKIGTPISPTSEITVINKKKKTKETNL